MSKDKQDYEINCPYCQSPYQLKKPSPTAIVENIIISTNFFQSFWKAMTEGADPVSARICNSCGKDFYAGWQYKQRNWYIDTRPVFLFVIPCITKKYRLNNGILETVGLFGTMKGSVPLYKTQFSLEGGGLFRLGVGKIVIRGRNTQELVWDKVFLAKRLYQKLITLSDDPEVR